METVKINKKKIRQVLLQGCLPIIEQKEDKEATSVILMDLVSSVIDTPKQGFGTAWMALMQQCGERQVTMHSYTMVMLGMKLGVGLTLSSDQIEDFKMGPWKIHNPKTNETTTHNG